MQDQVLGVSSASPSQPVAIPGDLALSFSTQRVPSSVAFAILFNEALSPAAIEHLYQVTESFAADLSRSEVFTNNTGGRAIFRSSPAPVRRGDELFCLNSPFARRLEAHDNVLVFSIHEFDNLDGALEDAKRYLELALAALAQGPQPNILVANVAMNIDDRILQPLPVPGEFSIEGLLAVDSPFPSGFIRTLGNPIWSFAHSWFGVGLDDASQINHQLAVENIQVGQALLLTVSHRQRFFYPEQMMRPGPLSLSRSGRSELDLVFDRLGQSNGVIAQAILLPEYRRSVVSQ